MIPLKIISKLSSPWKVRQLLFLPSDTLLQVLSVKSLVTRLPVLTTSLMVDFLIAQAPSNRTSLQINIDCGDDVDGDCGDDDDGDCGDDDDSDDCSDDGDCGDDDDGDCGDDDDGDDCSDDGDCGDDDDGDNCGEAEHQSRHLSVGIKRAIGNFTTAAPSAAKTRRNIGDI